MKPLLLAALLLSASTSVKAQSITSALDGKTELPPVVKAAHTHLIKPGSKAALLPFYTKLHNLRHHNDTVTKVNVLHIGGSHVQAGELTNTIRMHFEPAGERGMLFPYRAIKTNSPQSYRFEYTGVWKGERNVMNQPAVELGLSGAAAVTSDREASLTLKLRDEGRWNFSQLTLLGEASDSTVVPYLTTLAGDTLWADSILSRIADVEGTWVYMLPQTDSLVNIHFTGLTRKVPENINRKTYLPLEDEHHFVLRGMIPSSPRRGVTVSESGINGASLPSWLHCTFHFDQELSLLPPDLVIFGIGINDAHVSEAKFDPEVFKENYRQLVARIRAVNPNCCLLWLTNNDSAMKHGRGRKARYVPNKNGVRVERAMLELAEEFNGAVVNVFALMGGIGSSAQWVKESLMQRDRIHFTRDGYQLIGNITWDALQEDYARFYTDF